MLGEDKIGRAGEGRRVRAGITFFVSPAQNQVIPPNRWNDSIQHMEGIFVFGNEWIPVLFPYQT